MKYYLISIMSNAALGMMSQIPLLYALLFINGGFSFMQPQPKPDMKELVIGWGICIGILAAAEILNCIIYKKSKGKIKRGKLLFAAGTLSFVFGVALFFVGVTPPDIFHLI